MLRQAGNITVTAVPLPSVPAAAVGAAGEAVGSPPVAAAAEPAPIPAVPAGPAAPSPGVTGTISNVVSRIPCSCVKGQCGCCSGPVLASFNQKACLNITYEPNEFAFNAALSLNGQVFYTRRVSGKNPPPICIRVPRLRAIRVCVKLSNVYFTGANMHTCVDMEANWEDFTLFETSFDCFRIGANGVALVPPEAGGGVSGSVDEDDDDDDDDFDDYDDTARFIKKKVGKL